MSNSPLVPTGYGVVTKNVVFRLKKSGFDVDVVAYWGQEGSAIQIEGVTIYPKLFDIYGRDAARLVLSHVKPDVFITLFDVWVGVDWLPRLHPRWLAYTPVDHDPIPNAIYEALKYAFKPIAMSRFGFEKMKEAGLDAEYIPHGVDVKLFTPGDKAEARRKNLHRFEDAFIVGINAANKGYRKDFPRMFAAFKMFLDQNPDAAKNSYLYINSWALFPEGLNLHELAKVYEVKKNAILVNEWKKYVGMPDVDMVEWYRTLDVFLNLARGEGFGIPIVEAQACGVPVIATDFSSMTELVKDHGWLIPPRDVDLTPLYSYQALADVEKACDAINDAYNHPEKTEKFGREARKFTVENYDYDEKILPMWIDLLNRVDEESKKAAEKLEALVIKAKAKARAGK